ncbi:MAG: prepilin peptidase [Armatimonadota bacterium]
MPDWFGASVAFLYGIIVGSFLNVCIWRLPHDQSVVKPGSYCPKCKTPLRAWDLVPLLSFLVSGRKCRYCREPISWRYFTIELLTGLFFVATYYKFAARGEWLDFVTYALFGASLIAIFMIDLDHYIIPDQLSVFGILLGLARDGVGIAIGERNWRTQIFGSSIPVPESVVGILVCGVAFLALAIISYYIFKKEAMGGGDIKLAAAIGANIAVGWALVSFFVAVTLGSVIGVALILAKKKTRRDYVPFGPFMVAGALIVIFFSGPLRQVWDAYVNYVTGG